jgi:hypothetical protein
LKGKEMTITEIVMRYKELNPDGHFFDYGTLKYFGQTLKDFEVLETDNSDVYKLKHTVWFNENNPIQKTTYFNWQTGSMDTE